MASLKVVWTRSDSPPSRTTRLRVGPGVGDFSRNHLGIKLMRSIWRVRVGVETQLSQLEQRARLETFRQSRVVVVVDVIVVWRVRVGVDT